LFSMSFPSSLPFTSFLQYSPKGLGGKGNDSKFVRSAIKSDGMISSSGPEGKILQVNAIDRAVELIPKLIEEYPFLTKCFGPDVTLIPIPRSSPLAAKDALWPTHRICRALCAKGLAGDISTLLERHTPVQKSAFAQPGQRPSPQAHFDSTKIGQVVAMLAGKRITLVDDFITRGSTFIGMFPHVEATFPGFQINCFALVRTESYMAIEKIVAPVEGTITYQHGQLLRKP
jgi:hypothetical protein